MDAHRALERLRGMLPDGLEAELDHEELRVVARLDMLHLDADALSDRLHHWTLRELERASPAASAHLSFHRARPVDPEEESVLDLQEAWLDLEARLSLDVSRGVDEASLATFAAHVPRFVQLIAASGRPPGFRSVDVGTME